MEQHPSRPPLSPSEWPTDAPPNAMPPHETSPPPPPVSSPVRGGFPFLKVCGCGCGGCLFALIGFVILGLLVGDSAKNAVNNAINNSISNAASNAAAGKSTPAAPVLPLKYLGKWRGQDGTSLWIRADGKGDFDAGNTKVSGGGVTIDEKKKSLKISSFFGIGKEWRIDATPQTRNGVTTMKLDGQEFRRIEGFDAE